MWRLVMYTHSWEQKKDLRRRQSTQTHTHMHAAVEYLQMKAITIFSSCFPLFFNLCLFTHNVSIYVIYVIANDFKPFVLLLFSPLLYFLCFVSIILCGALSKNPHLVLASFRHHDQHSISNNTTNCIGRQRKKVKRGNISTELRNGIKQRATRNLAVAFVNVLRTLIQIAHSAHFFVWAFPECES